MTPPTRSALVAVLAISATGILANPLVLPVLPDIARDLGVSTGTVGLVVGLSSLPGVVVAPVIGVLADRLGRRTVVLPCLVIFGIGGVAAMVAPNFPLLLAARFLQGVGAAGLVNLAVVILGDVFTGPERARWIGRNAVVLTLGLSVFPTVGGALADRWGWRASFAPFALAFLVAVLAARALPKLKPENTRTVGEQVSLAAAHARHPRVVAMAATGFAVFILVFGVSVTLPIHLDEEFGASPVLRGVMLALPAVGAGAVSLSMGRLVRRWGAWDMAPIGFALVAVAYLGVAGTPMVALVALPALAYGLGEGLTIVPMQDYATAIAPDEHRGAIVAVWVSAVRAGQFVGPALAGLAIATLGTYGTFYAGALLAVATAAVVVVARSRLALRDTSIVEVAG